VYVVALLAIIGLTAVFAYENEGTQVFHLFGYAWMLPTWAPAVTGVGAVSALLVLVAGFSGLWSRLRDIGFGRELDRQRSAIDELRTENARLRGEVAALRGQLRGAADLPREP
jgi:hypothetical protein